MKALAMYPFKPDFEDVFKVMERACHRASIERNGKESTSGARSDLVTCENIGQSAGATFDIVKKLLDRIKSCDFCIADLTGSNLNVFYEVGFAMALEKPVILLTQDLETVPFDLRGLKTIQYERAALSTLEQSLIAAVTEVSTHLADVPVLSLHSKCLALSVASAVYFLDTDYRIHYMNEAAADLFGTSRIGGKSWVDSTLREFINDISHQLDNLPAIEKNLQVQTEEIRRLEGLGVPKKIPSSNIEPVILNSREYGRLDLQKTGLAVRDPSTGHVTGWVVSFDVVKSHEPDKYQKFHDKHKNQIQALLYERERGPRSLSDQTGRAVPHEDLWPTNARVEKWISNGCLFPQLQIANDYREKQASFDFCASVMKGDKKRYGLESVEFLDEWFFDFQHAEYVLMRTPDGDLVGVFRLHTNHDVTSHAGIFKWVVDIAREEDDNGKVEFADVGAYLHPSIEGKPRIACLATLVGRGARIAERNRQVFMYCQVPSYLENHFDSFLFLKAGKTFKCPGWRQPSWTPYAVKCVIYSDRGETPGTIGGNLGTHAGDGEGKVNHEFVKMARQAYGDEKGGESIV